VCESCALFATLGNLFISPAAAAGEGEGKMKNAFIAIFS
jgi:hypothetical protein